MSKEKFVKKNKKDKGREIGGGLEVENGNDQPAGNDEQEGKGSKIKKKIYEKEISKHHTELVKLQEWIKNKGLKVVVVFEGRHAAGKGAIIKKITQPLKPRVCRVADVILWPFFVDFQPGVLYRITGIPYHELINKSIDAETANTFKNSNYVVRMAP